ncbi:MAG: anti-sigma factor [Chroococcus sp. CMT-3BRIN-NPC107]|jgi:anti-sigma-K factor RskA|nr:anti-sigma factor [Chroococcus sp. CMT-3BRIN-NPC107]
MPSEQLELLIAGYVLGDLSAEEVKEFEQLLANNSAIAQEVALMQQALEISYAPPEVSPPSYLRSQVMAAHRANSKISTRPPIFSMRTMSAIAAVLIVALGFNNYRLWRNLQVIQAQQMQSEFLTYSLQPKNTSLASATVAVNPNQLEAKLNVENLPLLPTGKVYVLWTVLKQDAPFTTDKKNAILTEVFEVDAKGNVSKQITLPKAYRTKDLITAIAVTIEDAAAPQKHTGAPILIARL